MISLELKEDPVGDLEAAAAAKKAEYQSAKPFPHCCFDNLFSDELLEKVVEEFESHQTDHWQHLRSRPQASQGKSILDGREGYGPYSAYLFNLLSSPRFLRFVEELTGIPGLIVDPYFQGGGLHEIKAGGFLELHTDFNWQGHLHIYRRLNLLLYLNKDWKEEWGGALELWDRDLKEGKKYPPFWNRVVIQHVTADAMHGFPDPICCPEDRSRKSLAMWYYTSELPTNVQVGYNLCAPAFVDRKGEAKPLARPFWRKLVPPVFATLIKPSEHTKTFSQQQFRGALTSFLPPVLIEAFQKLRGRPV